MRTYRKKRSVKRNYRRKKPFTPNQIKVIKKVIDKRAEQKYIETEVDAVQAWFGATSYQTCLTLCAQGDDQTNRSGNSILAQSLQFRLVFKGDPLCGTDVLCRFIVYKAKDCNGAIPTDTNLLQAVDVKAMRNRLYNGDYKVLYDKVKLLPQTSVSASANTPFRFCQYYKQFKRPIKITYDDTTAVIASCERNHLFFLALCSWGADAYSPTADGQFRVRFTDA